MRLPPSIFAVHRPGRTAAAAARGLALLSTVALSLVGTAGGCGGPAATPDRSDAQLDDRLRNAKAIDNEMVKDASLQGIAADAAHAGRPAPCLAAVDAIGNGMLRDSSARDAAQTFDARGDRATAESLAERVSNAMIRDELLREYAEQPAAFPPQPPPQAPQAPQD